jgi:hypothetical protein
MSRQPDSVQEINSSAKSYFCELATGLIKKVDQEKALYPYMTKVVARHKKEIKQLKKQQVGKVDYRNLKRMDILGDVYEVVDTLELPDGSKIRDWPIILSLEIDDKSVQEALSERFKKLWLLSIANKEAGGGEAGKRAEDFLTALGSF